ncbi:inositol monophosphatase family protein [Dongia deserti]|uniref:inositol monophosphatase family protein n=1 Tax=Dongia deserti TaxID=2268030 RepID=UPI000E65150C|nr:inositol monophosphatase [Dongia deserti]
MKALDVDAVAALIAEVAATEIQPRFRNLAIHEWREKAPGDIVTIADEQAEAALTPLLKNQVPHSIVIGEEAAAKNPDLVHSLSADQIAWIVDPVDGTANFAEGKADFCSMVALVRGDELIASWLHLPTTGQTAIAERGAGATFDGVRIPKLSPDAEHPAGVVGVGKLSAPKLHPKADALRREVRQIRSLRCAGLDYLRLARGELDFVLFGRAWPWDHAPGVLLVAEAGGVGSHGDGSPYRPSETLTAPGALTARSPRVWRWLLERLYPEHSTEQRREYP